jgi:DnaK suppressor protein
MAAIGRAKINNRANVRQLDAVTLPVIAQVLEKEKTMNQTDLDIAKLRPLLVVRRESLRRSLNGELMLLSRHADDPAEDRTFCQLSMNQSHELAAVDEALERMRQGSYGECETCGEMIPLTRLQALPFATSCINCQRQAERGLGVKPLDWT